MPLNYHFLAAASALVLLTAVNADVWTRNDNTIAPNRMIIAYNDLADEETRSSIRTGFGVRAARTLSRSGDLELIRVRDGLPLKELARAIESEPYVAFVEPDYTISIEEGVNDEYVNSLYAMTTTRAREAWAFVNDTYKTSELKETVVCVIDTGVDYTHPDLKDNMWVNQLEMDGEPGVDDDGNGYIDDVYGANGINGEGDPMDDNNHGTHCAGTVAAVGNNDIGVIGAAGPSNKVKIMACKFLDAEGKGTISTALTCLDYALQMNATITSNSWGGAPFSLSLYRMVERAAESGQLFVAAAGNSFNDNDNSPQYPASIPNRIVMGVASVNAADRLSSFSNYGRETVDIAAPGSSILSTWPGGGYESISGTSMATPLVSGIAALMKAMKPETSALTIKKILMKTADRGTLLGDKTSSGRINALAAVKALSRNNLPPQDTLSRRQSFISPAQFFDPSSDDSGSDFDLEGTSLTFRSPKKREGYVVLCKKNIKRLPVSSRKNTVYFSLADDDSVEVKFEKQFTFEYYGVVYQSVFIGSNGYLTFGAGDESYGVNPAVHFKDRRISVLFADLDPSKGGQVTYRQKGGKKPSATITWDGVPRNGQGEEATFGNIFQVTLKANGAIKMSYMAIDTWEGAKMVGLSPGQRNELNSIWDVAKLSSAGKRKC